MFAGVDEDRGGKRARRRRVRNDPQNIAACPVPRKASALRWGDSRPSRWFSREGPNRS